ncbi:MAG TPA: universal stress protein [Desulfobulbus sp.]|nr:universal stress protein [Desulfobulbus sp.]
MADIKKVVVPVDFSSATDKVAGYATSVADKLGAHVIFFHVVNDFQGYDMLLVHPSFGQMVKELQEKSEARMAALVEDYKHLENGVSGKVVIGDAAEEIVKFAEEEKADMIIIGTHGVKGLERILMGSTAEKVVKKAPCPVLTFNPFK